MRHNLAYHLRDSDQFGLGNDLASHLLDNLVVDIGLVHRNLEVAFHLEVGNYQVGIGQVGIGLVVGIINLMVGSSLEGVLLGVRILTYFF